MKTTLIFIALLISAGATAQKIDAVIGEDGNYYQAKTEVTAHDSLTGKWYFDAKGNKHPMYKGAKGSLYIARISKAGNYYRQYFSTNTATVGEHAKKD
jgi:hypothetical protein